MMTRSAESQQLDYAPRQPNARRRRTYRWLVAATILFALHYCRNWPAETWRHFHLLYLQGQCLAHPIPAATVVYSSDTPERAIVSRQWDNFLAADLQITGFVRQEPVATVFLGQLQSANGTKNLVEVEAIVDWKPQAYAYVEFSSRTVRLGIATPLQESSQGDGGFTSNIMARWSGSIPEVAVYSATADKGDSSHVQFECRVFQEDYIIDGHLENDGRFVCATWSHSKVPRQVFDR